MRLRAWVKRGRVEGLDMWKGERSRLLPFMRFRHGLRLLLDLRFKFCKAI